MLYEWVLFKRFIMRQVTFSSQSLDVISSIPQIEQLSLVEKLSSLSGDILLEKGLISENLLEKEKHITGYDSMIFEYTWRKK